MATSLTYDARDSLGKSEYVAAGSGENENNNAYSKYDELYKQYQNAVKEKEELLKELTRLKDQKQLLQMKSSSIPLGRQEQQ
jgi:predicted nuclease with TOPRIM domain